MGLCESPVARDERRGEAFSERDVHSVGYGVGAAQLVGTLDERLCRPTPERQTLEVGNSHQPFVVGDQPARDRSTDGTNHLDIEVGRGMHCLAAHAPGHRGPRRRCENEFDSRRGVQHDHSDRASSSNSAAVTPRSRRGNVARRSRTSSRAGSSAISLSRASRKSLRLIRHAAARAFNSWTSPSGTFLI